MFELADGNCISVAFLETNKHLYFKIRMRGIFQHDWLIEQLLDKKGNSYFGLCLD